ncbi:hypothetical protein SAMN04488539_2269 [Corynebacterium timonense]|uniref:Uncharacterized protein n=1 Tax=Corynebacterium timonense TaxID=441500 RepID=A0A1H1UKZ1_9CORY|nr:hypothetical protein SAMN04488539_2269 [Corynebacterium timonense]
MRPRYLVKLSVVQQHDSLNVYSFSSGHMGKVARLLLKLVKPTEVHGWTKRYPRLTVLPNELR